MVAPSIFCSSNTNQIGMGDNTRFVFHRKPCLYVTNRLNSLKHMQHFDAHNSNQKKEKEKRKKKIFNVHLFVTHAILQRLLS